ncbi:K+-sensing histidine kinase KdpD [Staphylococcus epidermidis]|jgi:K+-sensing histidine kinase KdpD
MGCIDMLAIIIGFLVGVIGVSIIRVIWYVFSWILIKTVLTIRKFSDRLQDGIINFVSVLYGNIKDAINNQHKYSVRNRNQR